ncbi:MAG: NAD+ synthase [Dehalococcoidia bacterium]|nr:NAD+ synthase [Dehalococcoidia bacterium]
MASTHSVRLGLAQINTTVGDFIGNLDLMKKVIMRARTQGVDLVAFPELAVCGYPPEDLLLKPQFIEKNLEYLHKLVESTDGLTVVAGFVDSCAERLYNAAAVIHDGKLAGVYHKAFLPNYGVFDEKRYFCEGRESAAFLLGGISFGVNICEDLWSEHSSTATEIGTNLIVNISASPYHYQKAGQRQGLLVRHAQEERMAIAYVNLVGGHDELVFDGNSLVVDQDGQVLARGKPFDEDLVIADLCLEPRMPRLESNERSCGIVLGELAPAVKPLLPERAISVSGQEAEIYDALVLGTRDYCAKNGFKKAALGISGGIDSGLVAAVAVDALGEGNVVGVAMPSRYSSPSSVSDAEQLCRNLGIRLIAMPIEPVFEAYLTSLADAFRGLPANSAEENIQARIRGNFLMALSNKFGWLVLPTGNKSEMATGYATLYGDMAGGFAILKDVPKTIVYKLALYRNAQAGCDLIPRSVIDKPPSAELRPNQKDTDSLPPYDQLDPVIKAYVEEDKSVEQMLAAGMDEAVVRQTVRLIDGSEYKRRQAPPGIKITARAFGKDRRLPITNKFRGNG